MLLPTTENLPDGETVDALSALDAGAAMLAGQQAAVAVVDKAIPSLTKGAEVMAAALHSGHSIVYAAAGSSGLMALADASELPGTFGIPDTAVQIHMAGGVPVDGRMPGDTEDSLADVDREVQTLDAGDVAILLSASGTTPYAIAVAQAAKSKGATIIGLANNPGTKLLALADVPICLETPPERIAGSTRLGAGTAQKVALNMMSSLMRIKLGHVYKGMMVNVIADNIKLKKRAAGMVSHIAGVSAAAASAALQKVDGWAKPAVLVAADCTPQEADALLAKHDGHLGPCFQSLNQTDQKTLN